jgi:hypothetical protein
VIRLDQLGGGIRGRLPAVPPAAAGPGKAEPIASGTQAWKNITLEPSAMSNTKQCPGPAATASELSSGLGA